MVDSLAAFTAVLREEHGFGVGHAATRDALRATEWCGVEHGARLRSALRAVYCASPDEVARFDAAFDAFFFGAQGTAQPNLPSRRTRPGREPEAARRKDDESPRAREPREPDDDGRRAGTPTERRALRDDAPLAERWQTLRARYSAAAARAPAPPVIAREGMRAMLAAADDVIASLRITPARRRAPRRNGDRIDLRRTLRASVETAGDPIALRRTARVRRGARFAVLIDGSRSTSEHAGPMLQFGYALAQRARRAAVFTFSTALHDVTAQLRKPDRAGRTLDDLGEAWGGGTRIGDSVLALVEQHGARVLGPQTVVLIFSDGLDVGRLEQLERAMRALRTRSAAIVWLHPHAAAPGFAPSAAGLRAALPYVTTLLPARDADDFAALSRALRRLDQTTAAW